MAVTELGAVQERFAELLWERAPIGSGELVKVCAKELGWSKSTTYTVLRKLCEKGLFENANGTVTVRMTREAYAAARTSDFVAEAFQGSLPAFVAAFISHNRLTEREADEIRRMIDECKKEGAI